MAPALSSESKNQTVTLKTHLFALFSRISNPHLHLLVTLDLRDCLSEIILSNLIGMVGVYNK